MNVHELYDYVYSRVGQTAKVRFNSPQTPVRIIGSRVPGVPVVLKLVPQPLKQVLSDMAEQLSATLEENQLGKVGVLEFTSLTPEGEVLGASFGILGRYCGDEIGPGNQLVRPVEDQVIARLDERANEPHPLQRQDFPFRVSVNVKSQARKPLFFGNDCVVMLRNGEEYEI